MIKNFKVNSNKENLDYHKYEHSIFNSPVFSNKKNQFSFESNRSSLIYRKKGTKKRKQKKNKKKLKVNSASSRSMTKLEFT